MAQAEGLFCRTESFPKYKHITMLWMMKWEKKDAMQEMVSHSSHAPTPRMLVTSRQIGSMTKCALWVTCEGLKVGSQDGVNICLSNKVVHSQKKYCNETTNRRSVMLKKTFTKYKIHKTPYLHCTVEEAAVLSWLIEKSFGRSQGQHRPWLVNPAKITSWFSEELCPCHLIVRGKSAFQLSQRLLLM